VLPARSVSPPLASLEPRGTKERAPVEAVVTNLDVTADQRDADPDTPDLTPRLVRDRRLNGVGGRDRGDSIGEAGIGTVADPLKEPAAVRGRVSANDLVVTRQRESGKRSMSVHQARAALDIGEQEGEMSRRRMCGISGISGLHRASIPTNDVGRHRRMIPDPSATGDRRGRTRPRASWMANTAQKHERRHRWAHSRSA